MILDKLQEKLAEQDKQMYNLINQNERMKWFLSDLCSHMNATSDRDWKRRVQAMAYNLLNNLES